MRTVASIPVSLILSLLAAAGCGEQQPLLGVPDGLDLKGFAAVQVASAPTAVPVFIQFDDVNPCSGLVHTVTFMGTAWIHNHNGRLVVRSQRTITTSSGFEGRGTDTFVANGNIEKVTLNDMLTHESGDRIRAQFALVFDVSTSIVQVFKGAVTCVGR